MEESKLKNMVVLKNLPSNIVDEAIIILKNGRKIKNLQHAEQKEKNKNKDMRAKTEDYILKEAEMILNGYVSKIENKNNTEKVDNKIKKKYKKLKVYSIAVTIIALIAIII